jgi:hypothetical protein
MMNVIHIKCRELRNKICKPECVGSFNMDLRILVFYPNKVLRLGKTEL